MSSLCVFGRPYIRSLCNPVGGIVSHIHFGITSVLIRSSNRFTRRVLEAIFFGNSLQEDLQDNVAVI